MGNKGCNTCTGEQPIAFDDDLLFKANHGKLKKLQMEDPVSTFTLNSSTKEKEISRKESHITPFDPFDISIIEEPEEEDLPTLTPQMNQLAIRVEKREKALEQFKLKPYQDNINKMARPEGPCLFSKSKDTYIGALNDKREKEGKGRLISKEGALYEGQFFRNKRQGKGRQIYIEGDYYEGDWVNDLAQGQGIYVGEDETQYSGGFSRNAQHGYGVEKRVDGSVYSGGWRDGVKWGKGRLTWVNGCSYSGDFEEDAMQGYGRFVNSLYNFFFLYIFS